MRALVFARYRVDVTIANFTRRQAPRVTGFQIMTSGSLGKIFDGFRVLNV